jgi:hypothetical protein
LSDGSNYYDEVISQMGQPEALLIFGPGEAKLQLGACQQLEGNV